MNGVSVSRIISKNYKNLRLEEGIDLGALTVLIGANGSGKSNVISLLQFLQESLIGPGVEDRRGRTNFEDAIFRLGGTRILDANLDAPANVGIEFQFDIRGERSTLGIELLVQEPRRPIILNREFLVQESNQPEGIEKQFAHPAGNRTGPPIYYSMHNGEDGGRGYGVVTIVPRELDLVEAPLPFLLKIQDVPVNELALSAMPRFLEDTLYPSEMVAIYGPRGKILDSSITWKFYHANNMNLEKIRLSDPKLGQSDTYVSPTGENLALVVFNLIQDEFEFDDLLNATIKDFLPKLRRMRALPLGRYALTIEWYVEGCSEPFFLSEMSDGTVRMLCWAVILHSPKLPRLIVIDEPELGIHPAWMPILADWIKKAAHRTQVIVTTHSPDLLDHFTDQLDDGYVYVFQEDTECQSHFNPKRLDCDNVSGWLEDGWQLGDLYRVGNPAVGGWPW